jgi:hypothetical protein
MAAQDIKASLTSKVAYGLNAFAKGPKIDRRPLWIFVWGLGPIVAMIFSPHGAYNWVAWLLD